MQVLNATYSELFIIKGKNMPKYEYKCNKCSFTFEKLVFRGDEETEVSCPECGGKEVKQTPGASGLFNGISNFSSLAKDYS